jgi:uncharacterized membrane protein
MERSMKSKSQQTGLGIALGAALGAAFGVAAGHIAIWVALGVAIGVAIGSSLRGKGTDCPQCASVHQTHQNQKLTS